MRERANTHPHFETSVSIPRCQGTELWNVPLVAIHRCEVSGLGEVVICIPACLGAETASGRIVYIAGLDLRFREAHDGCGRCN
jgi:hypothetical protein